MEKENLNSPKIIRTSLIELLDSRAYTGVTLLSAKKGYGKTTLIDQWINKIQPHYLRLRLSSSFNNNSTEANQTPKPKVLEEPELIIREPNELWHAIASELERYLQLEIPDHSSNGIIEFIRTHSLTSSQDKDPKKFIIIIENYNNRATIFDSEIINLIRVIENKMGIIISTIKNPPKQFFQFLASTSALYLSENQLRFTRTELIELLDSWKNHSKRMQFLSDRECDEADLVETLYISLGGWPELVQVALEMIRDAKEGLAENLNNYGFSSQINQAIYNHIETTLMSVIPDNLRNAYISTAQLPLVTPRLSNQLKSINLDFSLINLLCDYRFLKVTKRFRSEYVDCLPILKKFRLYKFNETNKALNIQSTNKAEINAPQQIITKATNWYLKHGYIAESIYLLINCQQWEDAINLLESKIDFFYKEGDWHTIVEIISTTPRSYLSNKIDLIAKLTYSYFLGQRFEFGYCMLEIFHEIYNKNQLSLDKIPLPYKYLYQLSENYMTNPKKTEDMWFESDIDDMKFTKKNEHEFYKYLPELTDQESEISHPGILHFESYRQVFQEKNIISAINFSAGALEAAIQEENPVSAFQCLLTYMYLAEQAGELKHIHQCCSILNEWAESKRYCGFSFILILRFLITPYNNERSSQAHLEEEALTLYKLIENHDFDVDPLLEYALYRNMTTITHYSGDQIRTQEYLDRIKSISPILGKEFISLSSCPHHTIAPRILWQNGDYTGLGDYFKALQIKIDLIPNPLPPFNIESQQYSLLETHRKVIDCKSFNSHIVDLKSKARFHCIYSVVMTIDINHAVFLYRTEDENAFEVLKEAISISSALGYCRSVIITNRTLMEWLPYISSKLEEQSLYLDLLSSIGRDLPAIQAENYFSSSPTFKSNAGLQALSKREKEILSLLVTGMTNEEIANHLHRSINTVKLHIHKIFKKLGTKNRIETTNLYRDAFLEND